MIKNSDTITGENTIPGALQGQGTACRLRNGNKKGTMLVVLKTHDMYVFVKPEVPDDRSNQLLSEDKISRRRTPIRPRHSEC